MDARQQRELAMDIYSDDRRLLSNQQRQERQRRRRAKRFHCKWRGHHPMVVWFVRRRPMAANLEHGWKHHALQFEQWQSAGRPGLKHFQNHANGSMGFQRRRKSKMEFD